MLTMSSGTSNKVDTSTQVEYSFAEARRIIGQEDSTIKHLSTSLSSLSLREHSKGIRPPLVGQASSSSNDSVSLPCDSKSSSNTLDRTVTSPAQSSADLMQISDPLDHTRTTYLLNRNDYINQKPPEGSYSTGNTYSSLPPNDGNHDLIRLRSSSSASSVTSSKPLEWDNGADVGYIQCHVISGKTPESNMSTVERMALVRSSKLLRRSDPEGTTGGTFNQVQNPIQPKLKVKNFGYPNAESTPLGTCLANKGSPETVDFISPIPYEKMQDSEPEVYSSESEVCGQTLLRPSKESETPPNRPEKQKIPLFPETNFGDSVPNEIVGNKVRRCVVSANIELQTMLENVESSDTNKKKLSSSLENISNIDNNTHSKEKVIPYTLPRSQSQTDLYTDQTSNVGINIKSKTSRSNYLIQNLFKNKSASSSSVATVVNRNSDSPKHTIIQVPTFKKQSVGTQVSESLDENQIHTKLFTVNPFGEIPHMPKTVLTQQSMNKSNYFDFATNCKLVNDSSDQRFVIVDNNHEEEESSANNLRTHYHNGILCKGAHHKSVVGKEVVKYSNQQNTNFMDAQNCVTSVSFPFSNQSQKMLVGPANLNGRKIANVGLSLIDSVESSAKSGGCGTDKQYSVTVEDRVNSFEYFPGHMYENNERHQPINSCGTSSMSIENNTSNNATPEDQNKIWESSGGNTSSHFDKDAQRGVDILTDFVNTYENDTLFKTKLISRVIDKLISKNKIDKNSKYQDLMKNTPWVPPRPSNPVERNAVKIQKSKVPCEISSQSEKSGTLNTSSECFIPKPLDRNKCFPSFYQDNSYKTNEGEFSSTSNFTPDKVAQPRDKSSKPLKTIDIKKKDARKNHLIKPCESSNKNVRNHDWKEPVTKTERLVEERRKMQNDSSGSHTTVSQLLEMERKNQLFWIRSEIDHLSNLKLLLERQEELKHGLKNCKMKQVRCLERKVLKDKNRVEPDKTSVATSTPDAVNKKSSLKSRSSQPTKLNRWLKDVTESKFQKDDLDGWVSHHYDNNENIKSCMKRKSKIQHRPSQTKTVSDKDYVLYDEPPVPLHEKEHRNQSSPIDRNPSESTSTGVKDCIRRNQNERVLQDKSRQQVRVPKHGCHCPCQGQCQCCAKPTEDDTKKKEPVGYSIIFDNPKRRNKPIKWYKNLFEETGVAFSMGERKQKPAKRNKVGQSLTGPDNVSEKRQSDLDKRVNDRECVSLETEPTSNDSANDQSKNDLEIKKTIFKGGAGELQYYLLHNRPSYVSRAEDRRHCIAQMQYLRELRRQNKRRLLSLSQPASAPPPPPHIKVQRVFSQHKMRQMTEKKYRQLSEVKEKLQDTKKKESYRTNRLMAEVFKKNLQNRVLKGEVNLSNSVCVISSL